MENTGGQFKTIWEMKEIILRCFKECEEAGFIRVAKGNSLSLVDQTVIKDSEGNLKVLVNQDAVADHISKTLIGELQEFEILRQLSPMFRQFDRIKNDMKILDDVAARNSGFQELRIGQK